MNIEIIYQEAKTGKEKTVVYQRRTKKAIEKSLESNAKRGWFQIEVKKEKYSHGVLHTNTNDSRKSRVS